MTQPRAIVDTLRRATACRRRELWPGWTGRRVPELRYPDRLNAAVELLDDWSRSGTASAPCIHHADGTVDLRRLRDAAKRIAHVLVDDLGLVPGNRVLLRGANTSDAGGVLVRRAQGRRRGGGDDAAAARARAGRGHRRRPRSRPALTDAAVVAGDARWRAVPSAGPAGALAFGRRTALDARAADQAGRRSPTSRPPPRTRAHRLHLGHDRAGQGDGALPSRPARRRCDTFAALRPASRSRRRLHRHRRRSRSHMASAGWCCSRCASGPRPSLLAQAEPRRLLEAIQRHRATVARRPRRPATGPCCAPASTYDLASLRCCVSAGEPLPAAVVRAWVAATGIRIDRRHRLDRDAAHVHRLPGRTRSGPDRPAGSCPATGRWSSTTTGSEVPRGTVGRLAVRGPTGCRYLDDLSGSSATCSGAGTSPATPTWRTTTATSCTRPAPTT